LLKPSAEDSSLMELTLREGFIKNSRGNHTVIYGIDIIWMHETQAAFHKPMHAQSGRNPELRTLFFKLARMLNSCAVPVFVFDGPGRPLMKRGRHVMEMPHWLKADFERLINAFGFYSHQAPGEAEAELAYLNHIGVIDAVLTNDVDAFVFGAETVIRTCAERASSTSHKKGMRFTSYYSESLAANPQVRLLREDLFLIAMLAGGDYDQSGLIGCGVTLAQRISQSGLGRDLFMEMRRSADPMDVDQFLQHWRARLQHELSVDPNKTLGRRYQRLADSIEQDFPPWEVMDKYVHPVTSEQTAGVHWRPTGWVPQCPSLEKVTLCDSPATPPPYHTQRPPLTNGRKHKPVLRPTPPETVGRVILLKAC
ncbi:hypothetical protein APHAL10511_003509, partial [Amanita phalloides]